MSSTHSRNIRDPPKMSEPYAEWKEEVYIWSEYVMDKTPMNKQGLALFLSLEGDARKAAAKVKLVDMKKDNGLETVLKELDKFFMKDKDREAFLSYDRFHSFRRPAGMSVKDFLIKFELLRNTCSSNDVDISDKIVAHQMLESANLPLMKKELVKTTLTTHSSDNMRSQILKIFSEEEVPDVSSCTSTAERFQVKSECIEDDTNIAFYGSSYKKDKNYGRNRKGRRNNRQQYYSDEPHSSKRNPLDEFGNITECDCCHSIYHYAPVCPDNKRRQNKGGQTSTPNNRSYGSPSL